MSTTSLPGPYLYGGICPRCGKPEHGSIACDYAAGWPEPPKVEITGIDPYFTYERIADALERIADALEAGRSLDSEAGA